MKKKNVLALALAAGLIFSGTVYADGEGKVDATKIPLATTTADNGIGEGATAGTTGTEGTAGTTGTEGTEGTAGTAGTTGTEKPGKNAPKENNENGYKSEAAADAAGKAAITKAMPYYQVYLQYGNYHYRLLSKPSDEQEKHDAIYKQQPKALAESKFNPDQGYKTFEEAQKAAEAIIAKSDINKGYNITKGKDGKYYIELTIDAKKTKDLDRKEIKAVKPAVKANNNNVQTGVFGLTGVVATLAAASTALFKSKRK